MDQVLVTALNFVELFPNSHRVVLVASFNNPIRIQFEMIIEDKFEFWVAFLSIAT